MSRRTPRRSELVTPRSGPVTHPGGRSPPIDQRRNEVMYRLLGAVHANAVALRDRRGQGTVEYVALVMAGVVAAMKGFRTDEGKELGDAILAKIKSAVKKVEF